MRIEVAQDMLDRGIPRDPYDCAVALAISAACPGMENVHVGYHFIEWGADGDTEQVIAPPELSEYIKKIDRREPVSPRTFDLTVTT